MFAILFRSVYKKSGVRVKKGPRLEGPFESVESAEARLVAMGFSRMYPDNDRAYEKRDHFKNLTEGSVLPLERSA